MKNVRIIWIMAGIVVIISILFLFVINDSNDNDYVYNDSNNDILDNKLEMVKYDFKNNYSNITNIPKEYYTRPEFYYSQDMISKFKGQTQGATYGYGAYPGDVSYNSSNIKKGQYFDIYTFVHSDQGVITYQGLGLTLISPNDQLFETYVEPSDILLYPVNMNDTKNDTEKNQNWTYLVAMKIITKENIPKGKYEFRLETVSSSQEKRNEYYNITQNATVRYVEVSPFQPSKFFDFILYVN